MVYQGSLVVSVLELVELVIIVRAMLIGVAKPMPMGPCLLEMMAGADAGQASFVMDQ